MLEKQIFVQKPFKYNGLVASLLLVLTASIGVFALYREPYQVTSYLPLIVAAITFFALFGKKKHKVITADLHGCEIFSRSLLGTSPTVERFLWRDVSETKLIRFKGGESIFIVSLNGNEKELLNSFASSESDFHNLIAFANRATPHLPYQWLAPENSEYKIFRKVSRHADMKAPQSSRTF